MNLKIQKMKRNRFGEYRLHVVPWVWELGPPGLLLLICLSPTITSFSSWPGPLQQGSLGVIETCLKAFLNERSLKRRTQTFSQLWFGWSYNISYQLWCFCPGEMLDRTDHWANEYVPGYYCINMCGSYLRNFFVFFPF